VPAGREIDPVTSLGDPSIGGANSDGIASVGWFGGVVATGGLRGGDASGPTAGTSGSSSGLAAMPAVVSVVALGTVASVVSVSESGACAVLVVEPLRSNTLPRI